MAVLSLLFTVTAFLSALLLFWIEPMIAKSLLPVLGGVPSVWNTCMVFFQAMLLAGYAYAHLISTRLSIPRQAVVHGVLLCAAGLFLPVGVSVSSSMGPDPGANPAVWLLGSLFATIGLPFFIVSSNGPLLQQWLAHSGLSAARNPYALYSASNLGSLAGLLGYPILVEPRLGLVDQSRVWTAGFWCLVGLIGGCLVIVCRSLKSRPADDEQQVAVESSEYPGTDRTIDPTRWRHRRRWMALAFVPSSLLLGVTTYLTTDIASIPLLWIIPLATYLLSFIIVFSRHAILHWQSLKRVMPILAVTLVFLMLSRATQPILLLIAVHVLFLFVACMVCHGQLADERPPPARITEFYLWLSLGSVLGSACTALLAPVLLKSVIEYPVAIILACLLVPRARRMPAQPGWQWLDLAFPVLLASLTLSLAAMAPVFDWKSVYIRNAVVIGIPAIIAFTFVDRPLRFGLGLGAIVIGAWTQIGGYGQTLHIERNFFGVSRVTSSRDGGFHFLIHGNTLHGRQRVGGKGECEPLTYYHRTGPAGDIFKWLDAGPASARAAMIGLGAGSLGCYARPDQDWTFYEIDPAVIRIALDTQYFTYLRHCTGARFRIVAGDARLRLREAPNGEFRLIVLDAFSSDAIPIHLMTREAIQLYLSKLAPGGLMAFHISNRYLNLEPVMAALAKDCSLVSRTYDDWNVSLADMAGGKEQSQWVLLARENADLGALRRTAHWVPLDQDDKVSLWTDDFSNILSVFKWR